MTTFAQGARSQVTYVSESTFGVTPTTPATTLIPFVSFNINSTIDQFSDASIRADRQQRYSLNGNSHVAGDLDVNLTHHNFDPFFASLLTGSWASNVLKFGNTQSSFTVEQGALDVNQYWTYTGVMMDKLSLTINTTGVVSAKFSVLGKAAALASSTICATPTAVMESAPYTHLGGTFKEAGTTTALLTALTLNIDNKTSSNFTLGGSTTQNLSSGVVTVSGQATVMFQDAVIANKYLNGTATTLDFTLSDGSNTMEFNLPNVRYTGLTRTITGQGPISLTVPFTALYDNTSASSIVITRNS
jgi:hypothetical protein